MDEWRTGRVEEEREGVRTGWRTGRVEEEEEEERGGEDWVEDR